MSKKVTIQMIADKAGVSRGTVDRVLNNREHVKESARQKVLEAIQEMGYLSAREIYKDRITREEQERLTFGVILPNWTGHAMYEFQRGIEAAKGELVGYGITIQTRECKTELPDEVIDIINEFQSEGISGMAICALDDRIIADRIHQLVEEGIPVITFNSDIPNSGRVCFVGQDYVKSGRIAGELLGKCVQKNSEILAMIGNSEFNGHKSRLDGFIAKISEIGFSSDNIIIEETFNDYRLTKEKVLLHFNDHPEIRAVYMANRSVGGCVEALRLLGKTGEVKVICHDVSETTKRLLKDGSIDFTIDQNLYRQGRLPLLLLRDLLQKGKKIETENMTASMISIYCSENIQ